MSKPARLLALWGPPLALMALIFAFSAMPSDVENRVPGGTWCSARPRTSASTPLLCALWFRALRQSLSSDSALAAAVGICLLYAISDEVHQTFVDGRIGTWRDVLIDTAGALTAAVAIRRWAQSQPRSVASRTA